jgi:hypothetical protein
MKDLQLEAMEHLTGSKEYQAQLKAIQDELADKEDADADRETVEGTTSALASKPNARTTRSQSQGTPKAESGKDLQRLTSNNKDGRGIDSPMKSDAMELVLEIRDALKTMATTFVEVAKRIEAPTQDWPRQHTDSDGDRGAGDSTEEDESYHDGRATKGRKRGSLYGQNSNGGKSTRTQWYYAVAHGRVPGVYTDWGLAERQVNGYSGAVHKKFQDHKRAEKFVRDNRRGASEDLHSESTDPSGSEESEEVSEEEGTGNGQRRSEHTSKRASLKTKFSKGPGMPPLEMSTPDPSIGNSKELFKMTLANDRTMCEKLSPPGLDG